MRLGPFNGLMGVVDSSLEKVSAAIGSHRRGLNMEFSMFIAMNRFKVHKGSEGDFEQVWLSRETHLEDVPGFITFHLLKGPEREDHVLYASHSVWRSQRDFEAWTRSEAFRKAHARAGEGKPLYQGHPEFEGFTPLQEVRSRDAAA